MTTGLPRGREFTVADLDAMPDDGNRYDLIDGMLTVDTVPGTRHQKMVTQLGIRLDAACPDDLHVLIGPFAVRPSDTTELRPDLLVARQEDLTEELLPVAPLLAVEVLSPSSALNDLNNRKAVYARMGVPRYWVADPEQPGITEFELDADREYQLVAEVKGSEVFEAERPFPVRIVPVELLGTLAR